MRTSTPVRADCGLRPAALPRWRGTRPLKRWTYVGVFGEGVQACFGDVGVAGLPTSFWAVWDGRELRERTRRRGAAVSARRVVVPGVADLALAPAGEAVEVRSLHGGQEVWTRKLPVLAGGVLGGRSVSALPGLVDESAGWHGRDTRWSWSAGAGVGEDGDPVWWNLVAGLHDDPRASERTVWAGGAAREVGPVAFDAGLGWVRPEGPAGVAAGARELRFTAEAERSRDEQVLGGLLTSRYRQPFGRFAGTLPDGTVLRSGQGVMERHEARW